MRAASLRSGLLDGGARELGRGKDKSPIRDENDEEVPRAHKAVATRKKGEKRGRGRSNSGVRQKDSGKGGEWHTERRGGITDEERKKEKDGGKRAYGPHLPIARGR